MTRKDLAKVVAEETGLPLTKSERVVRKIFEAITEELKYKKKVSIAGFGTFYWREYKGRKVKHPRTKEEIEIPNRFRLEFEATRNLRYLPKREPSD
jgi:nucleoid DNA-binding protein